MKLLLILMILLLSSMAWAEPEQRYLEDNKILYETPQEADVLRVNTAMGFCTVLEFKEKPKLVTVGDNSLIQVEIPQNSKTVIIKPLQPSGETNLFVFTASQRFNYKVSIADQTKVDYVVDTKESFPDDSKEQKKITVDEVLKLARNYPILKDIKVVNERKLIHKDLFYTYSYSKFKIDFIEAFTNQSPHYLILHISIHNTTNHPLKLIEKSTNLLVHNQPLTVQYILFDSHKLGVNGQTDGWLVLEGSYVSIDNPFECQLGTEDEDNELYTDIS
ncbi:MAG: TrbG/VirB9 family P-type conjugative transfer protein [Candidatus Omnitrophica bacterium]|nr:TrbG/VirB9 family P-type conjugative transfer protein [Candidatus Omnitrophota bacterium]